MAEGVSHKDYTDARIADARYYNEKLRQADLLLAKVRDEKNAAAVRIALDGTQEATKVALNAANEGVVRHNGLIEMMRAMMGDFINWRTAIAFLGGAGVVAAIYSQVTG